MNVLIIPEDFRKDQYVLKPIVTAMLKAAGTPRARIEGGGRKMLALEAARRYDRIRQLCPEDVAALEIRIRDWMKEAR